MSAGAVLAAAGSGSSWTLFTVVAALVTIANLEHVSLGAALLLCSAAVGVVMGILHAGRCRRTVVAVVIACAGVGCYRALVPAPAISPSHGGRRCSTACAQPMDDALAYSRESAGRVRQTLRLRTTFCPCSSREATCVDGSSTEHLVPCRSPCNSLADGSSPNAVRSPNCPLCLALAATSRRAGTRVSTLRRLRWCSALPSARCSRGCWG